MAGGLRRARPEDRARLRRSRARWRRGRDALLAALKLRDEIGQLEYKVWYFASLWYDQDQRDNQINAKRQQVQILFAKAAQASAWFDPELLEDPARDGPAVDGGGRRAGRLPVCASRICTASRSTCSTTRASGCCRCRAASRRRRTTRMRRCRPPTSSIPSVTLSDGAEATLTYGQYRAILATNRNQADRAAAFHAFHKVYEANVNTYASLYNGVLQRDWFYAQARGYTSTLDAALHGNNIPTAVVENLIEHDEGRHRAAAPVSPAAQAGARARHAITRTTRRSRSWTFDRKYPYDDVLDWLPASVARARRRTTSGRCASARRPVHRRLREPGQAQRRLFGAGLRRAAVHAAELQRHARRRVHAGARDGALDAHGARRTRTSRSSMRATRSSSRKCRPR